MKNGLKIYGAFKGIFIEPRIGAAAKDRFVREYGSRTGEDVTKSESFMVRSKNGWQNAQDTKMYFDAPQWVRDSLGKLGYRVTKRQVDMFKYKGGLQEYPWKICSNDLFWRLIDYGYRSGRNNAIPYESYELRRKLEFYTFREPAIIPQCDIRIVEADNPIYEAQMFLKANIESVEEPVLV